MADRRQVLKAGLAASAVPAPLLASAARAAAPLRVRRAVYDDRFEAGRAFGFEARSRGWPARAIRGDITDVWFHDLDRLWKSGPSAVAGVTTTASLFCLERLAWDAGLRVVSREAVKGAPLISWLIAPRARAVA